MRLSILAGVMVGALVGCASGAMSQSACSRCGPDELCAAVHSDVASETTRYRCVAWPAECRDTRDCGCLATHDSVAPDGLRIGWCAGHGRCEPSHGTTLLHCPGG